MKQKKIAILGAGISGLYAAYRLAGQGYEVTIYEKNDQLGGLAGTFPIGKTHLEKFYHHFFTTDKLVRQLVEELGMSDKLYYKNVSTAVLDHNQTYALNGPSDLLKINPVSLFDRLRTGLVLAYLKITKNWQRFSKIKARDWLIKWQGEKAYNFFWQPLFKSKFGQYWQDLSMSWFWARIHLRSQALGYLKGGYQVLFDKLANKIKEQGVLIKYGQTVKTVRHHDKTDLIYIETDREKASFDLCLTTLPESTLKTTFPDLSKKFIEQFASHNHVGAQTLILILDRRFLDHYWLNMNDPDFPFLVVVDQSYLADVKEYDNLYPVYFGNYLNYNDPRWQMAEEELYQLFLPFIKKIKPDFEENWIKERFLFRVPAAQFVITTDYQQTLLPIKLPIKNCYAATLSQIYPAERSLNYSMEVVDKALKEITKA